MLARMIATFDFTPAFAVRCSLFGVRLSLFVVRLSAFAVRCSSFACQRRIVYSLVSETLPGWSF